MMVWRMESGNAVRCKLPCSSKLELFFGGWIFDRGGGGIIVNLEVLGLLRKLVNYQVPQMEVLTHLDLAWQTS